MSVCKTKHHCCNPHLLYVGECTCSGTAGQVQTSAAAAKQGSRTHTGLASPVFSWLAGCLVMQPRASAPADIRPNTVPHNPNLACPLMRSAGGDLLQQTPCQAAPMRAHDTATNKGMHGPQNRIADWDPSASQVQDVSLTSLRLPCHRQLKTACILEPPSLTRLSCAYLRFQAERAGA